MFEQLEHSVTTLLLNHLCRVSVGMTNMRKVMLVIALALVPMASLATNITLQSLFTADDDVQLFSVVLGAPAAVDFRSYGYGGGTTSTGLVVSRGGFDTILTLFTGSGEFVDDNDDGAGAAVDPTTGMPGDARITANLAAGSYILALTQFDNFSIGDFVDGFAETGHPNFTADPTFAGGGACPGNVFRDISGTAGRCRSGNWTVDFVNVSSVTPALPVPEPPTLPLTGLGLGLLLALRRRLSLSRRNSVVALGLLATLASMPLRAQTPPAPPPDYSNVSDFLNGQRSLLNVTDIQIFRQNNFPNFENFDTRSNILQVQTANSAQALNPTNLFPVDELATFSSDASKPNLSFSAHMFNQPSASTLTTLSNFQKSGSFALWLQNVVGLQGGPGWWSPLSPNDNPITTSGAVADFTGDGYDDLALSFADGRLLVLTPNDLNNVFANFKEAIVSVDMLSAIAAGDFKGDSHREIAGLNIQSNGSVKLEIFTVDPTSLTPTLATSLLLTMPSGVGPSNPITKVAMAKGRFNSAGHDQLAVTFATASGPTIVEIVDFAVNTLTPFEGPQLIASTTGVPAGYLQVQTGKFGLPSNPYDQIIFHMSSVSANSRFFEPITADSATLTLTAHSGVTYNQFPCAAGIAVGNFDNRLPDPTPTNPNQTKPNLNSQIALLYCNNGNPFNPNDTGFNSYSLNFYNVDSNFNVPTNPVSGLDLTNQLWFNTSVATPFAVNLIATDLQGRSVTLGEPTKITVKSAAQPIAIIGVPPMHVDWISPTVAAAPMLTDVSYVWTGYNTTYQQENTTTNASTSTNTTSWSFGAAESGMTSVTIGDPDEGDGLSISDTAKAAQDLKESSTSTHGVFTGYMFGSSRTTGIDDVVFYVNNDFSIWTYPVIGKTVCPNGAPNCAQRVPLTIQYSAANGNPIVMHDEGATLTWYQPPWEPGNIFSYPATSQSSTSYGQLSVLFPNLSVLAPGDSYETSTSASMSNSSWQNSTTGTASAGLNQNFSFDNNFSVSGQIGIEGLSLGIGADIDVNGSTGFDNLTERTTTIGSSTGIMVNVPGVFREPVNYGYNVTPYIIGFQPPAGTVDNQPVTGNITASGFMSALYTWSPQGSWWQVYNQAPDIALNHPSRWTQGYGNLPDPNAPTPFPCLNPGGGQYLECPILNTPTPTVPANDDFHYLRGLFISSASAPGQGPQLEQAAVGQKLSLQARVYNYSLASMSAGTQAMAAFYVAPWDADNAPGQAVLVGTPVKVPAIPPFDPTSGTTLNWLLTPPVVFDPSDPKYQSVLAPSSSVMFYVVVWMQDSAGNLLTEMPAHGFTAHQVSATPSLSEWIANEEPYSNNVGLFYQEISVLQPPAPGALVRGRPPEAPLAIGKIDISANRANFGDSVLLTATLVPSDATSGVTVNFYDGDPQKDGRMFREVRIPYMAANAPHRVRTTFRPRDCGTRQLFAVVNRGKASEIVRSAPPVRVACLPPLVKAAGSRSSQ